MTSTAKLIRFVDWLDNQPSGGVTDLQVAAEFCVTRFRAYRWLAAYAEARGWPLDRIRKRTQDQMAYGELSGAIMAQLERGAATGQDLADRLSHDYGSIKTMLGYLARQSKVIRCGRTLGPEQRPRILWSLPQQAREAA